MENEHDHADLITEIADSYASIGHFLSALRYYQSLEGKFEANVSNTVCFTPFLLFLSFTFKINFMVGLSIS